MLISKLFILVENVNKRNFFFIYHQTFYAFSQAVKSHTVGPFMTGRCTELSKLTSPSLWNLTVDLVARFSQTFDTRASFHKDEEVGYNLLISNHFLPSKLLFYTLNLSSQLETDRIFSFRISACVLS